MSILDKIKSLNLSKPKESLNKGIQSGKKLLILASIIGAFIGGYFLGTRAFETGNLSSGLKNANITVSGVCKSATTGEDRFPALLDDEVKVTEVNSEKNTLSVVIRKTREDLVCDMTKVSYTSLPLLSKWGVTPVAVPELTMAAPAKKQDPYWKMFEKKAMIISGTCKSAEGKDIPNFIDEKIEVVSTTGINDDQGQFILTGIKRSDKMSIICNSKLITYRLFDPATEPKETMIKDTPIDFVGKIVEVDSKCIPDPKYLKERKVDPKTKKLIGRVPKFYNLLNTPVQVLDYKMDESNKVIYLEGKIVDASSGEAYGKKIICDAKVEKLYINYSVDKDNSLVNQKGEDISVKTPVSNLEVVNEGDETQAEEPKVKTENIPAEPAVIDEKQRLNDLLKELEK